MNILTVIPVRMGSSRFPGKPLKMIKGKPMVQRILENCKKSRITSEIIIATCDEAILNFAKSINQKVVMTSKKHSRASDRVCEAVKKIERKKRKNYDIVIMVQGDEPMVSGKMIDLATKALIKDKNINVVNLVGPINTEKELLDKNTIKVTHDKKMNAIYLSRSVIPHYKKFKKNYFYKQVCVIPFRRDFLFKYSLLSETKLEIEESIDMLRVIENGYKLKFVKIKKFTHAVDNIKDLKLVETLI